ncbi:hypothetical protein VNPA131289_56300 [Pseudomonas aeruginosa]|nr:hypothetical protein VNPA131289_56300 [Pseudomonas aeruginosa]GLF30911.1 hypothetical protein VNPA141486_55200 [Pseudomonas aeruginosa]
MRRADKDDARDSLQQRQSFGDSERRRLCHPRFNYKAAEAMPHQHNPVALKVLFSLQSSEESFAKIGKMHSCISPAGKRCTVSSNPDIASDVFADPLWPKCRVVVGVVHPC